MVTPQSSEKSLQEMRDSFFGMGFRQMQTVQGDGRDLGAYGRSRSAGVDTLFEYQPIWGLDPLRWDTFVNNGTATFDDGQRRDIVLFVSGAAGGKVTRQTRAYIPQQPGKSLEITMAGQFSTGLVGAVSEIGYFDDSDGVFCRVVTTAGPIETTSWTLRSSASGSIVDTVVPQEEWNLDTLIQRPGGPTRQNPSNINLDVAQYQIIVIDLQPTMGRIRVGFNIGGVIHYVHEFQSANILGVPSMATSQLPLRYEIRNDTNASFMRQSYCSAISEGGDLQSRGLVFSAATPVDPNLRPITTEEQLITIKPMATFRGLPNRVPVTPLHFNVLTKQHEAYWALYLNASLAMGATFTFLPADAPNSSVEYDATSNNDLTPGTLIDSGFIPTGGGDTVGVVKIPVPGDLRLGRNEAGDAGEATFDRLTLAVTVTDGGNADFGGSATWSEHQ